MFTQDEFQQQVRDALHHLYDYPYLESHPLALRYWPEVPPGGPRRAHRFNRLLLESIEDLNPAGAANPDTSRSRFYTLLVYRYVDERPLAEIMRELGYSRSHFFREQQKAITLLASTLWQKLQQQAPSPPATASLLDAEADRLLVQREAIDPVEVIQGVLDVVRHLAAQHGVTLACDLGQVLLKALSYLISRPGTRQIRIRMRREGQRLTTELITRSHPPASRPGGPPVQPEPELQPVRRLVEMMGGHWLGVSLGAEKHTCGFDLPLDSSRVLLVIDDNEGIISAFQAYLGSYGYGVVGTRTGAEALRVARQLSPAAITLDIMMPAQDGWEILQALKDDPLTQPIPVIICSVLEDPQLARSLGAAAYLQKPVSQADLLGALDRLASHR
jgi:CheY-like chemotaxis protein